MPAAEKSGEKCMMGKKSDEMYMTAAKKAEQFFLAGYNCAQSVLMAFDDYTGMDEKTAAKFASSFGGGLGRLREVCGAFSGLCMALGLIYGDYPPEDREGKRRQYAIVQALAGQFKEQNGALRCADLLQLPGCSDPTPDRRSDAYYKKRPCARIVFDTARLLEEYLLQHGQDEKKEA